MDAKEGQVSGLREKPASFEYSNSSPKQRPECACSVQIPRAISGSARDVPSARRLLKECGLSVMIATIVFGKRRSQDSHGRQFDSKSSAILEVFSGGNYRYCKTMFKQAHVELVYA